MSLQLQRLVVAILLSLAASGGCSAVRTRHPVGQHRSQLDSKNPFDGVWVCEGAPFFVKQIANGQLRVGLMMWQADQFMAKEFNAELAMDEDVSYLNVITSNAGEAEPKYVFFRIAHMSDKTAVLFPPRVAAFEAAVTAGRLRGKAEKDALATTVWIESPKLDFCHFSGVVRDRLGL